jgi:hypothetical protein
VVGSLYLISENESYRFFPSSFTLFITRFLFCSNFPNIPRR